MIARVISGGQTGVDVAALRAALALGIPTGGTMPLGWRTLDGPRPEYEALFGMRQHHRWEWDPRTFANVANAHATLRLAYDWNTGGELCTLRACAAVGRLPFDIGLDAQLRVDPERAAAAVAWIREQGPGLVLNVAGNSELTARGIEAAAEAVLTDIFRRCLEAA